MSIFSFIILYALAVYYRKNTQLHMRYMICTGLLIFIPGFARLLIIGIGISGMITGLIIMIVTYGLYISLIVFDKMKKNPVGPYVVGITLVTLTNLAVAMNKSAGWQWLAGSFADLAF